MHYANATGAKDRCQRKGLQTRIEGLCIVAHVYHAVHYTINENRIRTRLKDLQPFFRMKWESQK